MATDAAVLRIMTFNIQHGRGADGRVDLGRVAEVVRGAGVDVAGLQEVDRHYGDRSGFADQARWLAAELGMDVAYGANTDLAPPALDAPRRQFGNAVLSAFPILAAHNSHLPRSGSSEQRGVVHARIAVRGVTWQVHVTHLQHDSSSERRVQAEAIRQLLGTPDRTVLVGDLNAQPGTPEVRALTDVLVDAWAAAGEGPGHTSASPTPSQRIDYVLHSADVRTRAATVLTGRPAAVASDHLPVVAEIVG